MRIAPSRRMTSPLSWRWPTQALNLLVGWDYTQSRSTASLSAPLAPGGVGIGGVLRENLGAGAGWRCLPSVETSW